MNSQNNEFSKRTAFIDRLFALVLQLLPHHLLSALMYTLTRSEWPVLKRLLINTAIRVYRIDMSIAEHSDPEQYTSFNEFFTRALKPETRPLTTEHRSVACPVDGSISEAQQINNGLLFQAKGQYYSLQELLGGDKEWAERFADGNFATIYLSPRDYHRIHMPLSGRLIKMTHVPGRLFSVNNSCARTIPRLFSRNERIVNLFETEAGPMAVIMVGAIFVASMDTVWAGCVAPRSRSTTVWNYAGDVPQPIELEKGAEMGRFNMGSTVILLFGKDTVHWSDSLQNGAKVKIGEEIGKVFLEPIQT